MLVNPNNLPESIKSRIDIERVGRVEHKESPERYVVSYVNTATTHVFVPSGFGGWSKRDPGSKFACMNCGNPACKWGTATCCMA